VEVEEMVSHKGILSSSPIGRGKKSKKQPAHIAEKKEPCAMKEKWTEGVENMVIAAWTSSVQVPPCKEKKAGNDQPTPLNRKKIARGKKSRPGGVKKMVRVTWIS
jgi:hypothetical protein